MAFRPSQRRSKPGYILDLNLAPLLSLFVALIPMLLLTAMFQKVGIVNLYLPTLEEALLQDGENDPSQDFTLSVSVTLKEMSLMKDREVLITEDIQEGLKLDRFIEKLVTLKKEFPDKRDAVLLLDSEILYETIIDIMDAVRVNGDTELFPDISLADRILEEG
ncbi:MAG: biopolymer transporter ExbD [bacterium]|nr:biopolymer transporter ExbD [bacterium]MDT8366811.1 biopolymer transporter ExbD [bacterium]